MPYKVIPADFTVRLARIQAELARRDGNGDLSSYAAIDFPGGTPVAADFITADIFNTLVQGLEYINDADTPDDAVAGETYINTADLTAIDALLTAFEAQDRGAVSGNDCAALCSGMCITQCTTTCLSTCTGGCSDTCSTSCTGTCEGECTSCTSCTGTCSSTCTGGCTGSCTDTCAPGCYNACSWNCNATCKGTCDAICEDTCYLSVMSGG